MVLGFSTNPMWSTGGAIHVYGDYPYIPVHEKETFSFHGTIYT